METNSALVQFKNSIKVAKWNERCSFFLLVCKDIIVSSVCSDIDRPEFKVSQDKSYDQ